MSSKKILVIDDDRGVLEAVRVALEANEYDVQTATDEEYLDTIDFLKNSPDLILLDMYLSGADGREVCMRLKSQKNTKHIPIIIFSAAPNAMQSVKKAAADAFLPKPFSIKDLLKTIEEMLPK
jgi:CheY-like chemotaxis protein